MTIIESVRTYLENCPQISDSRFNVDFLPEQGIEFSISPIPNNPIVKQYTNGSALKLYSFALLSNAEYGSDAMYAIEQIGIYEDIVTWLDVKSRASELPQLSEGKTSIKIEAVTRGYLFGVDATKARYQIQINLTYLEE